MDYLNFSLFLFYGAVVYIGKTINMLDFIPLGIYRKYYRQYLDWMIRLMSVSILTSNHKFLVELFGCCINVYAKW